MNIGDYEDENGLKHKADIEYYYHDVGDPCQFIYLLIPCVCQMNKYDESE